MMKLHKRKGGGPKVSNRNLHAAGHYGKTRLGGLGALFWGASQLVEGRSAGRRIMNALDRNGEFDENNSCLSTECTTHSKPARAYYENRHWINRSRGQELPPARKDMGASGRLATQKKTNSTPHSPTQTPQAFGEGG